MNYGVYIHLPWCRYRCPYCAFVVDARKEPPHAAYEEALLSEWALRRPLFVGAASSVYFGGGTPSRSPLSTFRRLLEALSPAENAEITAEANPEDCADPLLEGWKECGINRLSIGVQSFFEATASRLGRRRSSRVAERAVRRAQELGFKSISIDLIFGGPGQTLEQWDEELRRALDLGIQHCSIYGLTQEEGTAFGRLGERLQMAEEDLWREMYDRAVERLEAGGIHRYEVSNFGRDGHRSVHNQHYWRARPWAGLGAGAHAWLPDRRRTENTRDIDAYLQMPEPIVQTDAPDHPLASWDLLWSMLRHVDGIDLSLYTALTKKQLNVPPVLLKQNLVTQTPTHLKLTDAGFPIADGIARMIHRFSV